MGQNLLVTGHCCHECEPIATIFGTQAVLQGSHTTAPILAALCLHHIAHSSQLLLVSHAVWPGGVMVRALDL